MFIRKKLIKIDRTFLVNSRHIIVNMSKNSIQITTNPTLTLTVQLNSILTVRTMIHGKKNTLYFC